MVASVDPPAPVLVEGELEYVVEKILDSRISRRKLQYLVKWKGYGQEDNSWVVASDVHAADLVRAFHLARPDRPGGSGEGSVTPPQGGGYCCEFCYRTPSCGHERYFGEFCPWTPSGGSNAISQSFQNSFFDIIVIVKKLPYLPKLVFGKNCAHDICAEDFMVTDLRYLVKGFKYKDVRNLLKSSDFRQFPIVDAEDSRILLGSVSRKTLSKLLSDQLSTERRMQYMMNQPGSNMNHNGTVTSLGDCSRPKLPRTAEEPESGDTATYSAQETITYESEEVEEWECRQLNEVVPIEDLIIDPAPYRLMEKQTLYQCYDLFNLLGLRLGYVTRTGQLVGVVSLSEVIMVLTTTTCETDIDIGNWYRNSD
ncbi:unnamed protein product [Ranitomeya imitator]|uniref:CBS domain-containing protein n=1 Tax=Ranitomeya imitator TaxID=111125 RepID=A0ABN9KPY8_9NEOB|nr:unnamed protein product [Ranitomeya imitator]